MFWNICKYSLVRISRMPKSCRLFSFFRPWMLYLDHTELEAILCIILLRQSFRLWPPAKVHICWTYTQKRVKAWLINIDFKYIYTGLPPILLFNIPLLFPHLWQHICVSTEIGSCIRLDQGCWLHIMAEHQGLNWWHTFCKQTNDS